MSKVNSFLTSRFKAATQKLSKMANLAELSSSGQLSSFSGVFRVTELSQQEKGALELILKQYGEASAEIEGDLVHLSAITAEVKAINNQAAILHGERIKRAQQILLNYKEGAFTAWLIATYGNRQTPYNFLQYYELFSTLHPSLHAKLETMPRHAVYVLASRSGSFEKKEEIVKNYEGEPKQELLALIRETFPLDETDRRSSSVAEQTISLLLRAQAFLSHPQFRPTAKQREALKELLQSLSHAL